MLKFSVKIMQDGLTETPTSCTIYCTVNHWSDCHGIDCTFFIIKQCEWAWVLPWLTLLKHLYHSINLGWL